MSNPKSDGVTSAGVKRLLVAGASKVLQSHGKKKNAGSVQVRVTRKAIDYAHEQVLELIRRLALQSVRTLKTAKRKTITKGMLISSLENLRICGLGEDALFDTQSSSGKKENMTVSGINRAFKAELGDFRTDASVKEALKSIANTFVVLLGSRGAEITAGSNRSTLSSSDVEAAVRLSYNKA